MTEKKSLAKRAGNTASKTLREGGSAKSTKTAAGSALSQRPMSKVGKITSRQADKAVRDYLSGKRA